MNNGSNYLFIREDVKQKKRMKEKENTGGYEYTYTCYGDEDLIVHIQMRSQRNNKEEEQMRTQMSRTNN